MALTLLHNLDGAEAASYAHLRYRMISVDGTRLCSSLTIRELSANTAAETNEQVVPEFQVMAARL